MKKGMLIAITKLWFYESIQNFGSGTFYTLLNLEKWQKSNTVEAP